MKIINANQVNHDKISGDCDVKWSLTVSNADSVKWFHIVEKDGKREEEEIEDCDEFQLDKSGPKNREIYSIIFGEVFPDDDGEYRVEISKGDEIMTQTATLNGMLTTRGQNSYFW